MIRTLIICATIIIATLCGSMWWLGNLAFGDARVSGVNAIPAAIFLLVVFSAIFFGIYGIFASMDWINDLVASKAVRQTKEEVKSLRDVTNLVSAQTRAMAGLKKSAPPLNLGDGGLLFDEETFSEKNLPTL